LVSRDFKDINDFNDNLIYPDIRKETSNLKPETNFGAKMQGWYLAVSKFW